MSGEAGTAGETTATSGSINIDSIRAIAKKDFQDAVRSMLFLSLSLFFFLVLVIPTIVQWYFGAEVTGTEETTAGLVLVTHQVTRFIIPLIAVVLGWKAIAGERNSGSIKILLSLPHSRKDVLIGKFIGRSAVLSLSLVAGFVFAAVVVAVLFGGFDVVDYVGLLVVSILYGIAYTSIAVSVSSLTKNTSIAAALAASIIVTFYIVWESVLGVLALLVQLDYLSGVEYTTTGPQGEITASRPHQPAFFFNSFDPGVAYRNVLSFATSVAEESPDAVQSLEDAFDGSVPFYLQDWFAIVVLVFWITVPLAIALYRFDRVDI